MSELTSLQLAHRINSEGTDDSPFGSALNTPADERPPILDFDKAFNERLVGVDVISDGREIIRKELGLVNDTSISSLDLNHSCKVDDDDHFNVAGKGGVARYRDEVASLEKGHGEELSTSNSPTSTAEEAENDEHEDGVVAISPLLTLTTLAGIGNAGNALISERTPPVYWSMSAPEGENPKTPERAKDIVSPLLTSKSPYSNPKSVSTENELSEFMFTADVETPMMEPSSSAVSSSPEVDFGRHQRGSSFYNLPNDPICISPSASSVSVARRLMECVSTSASLDGLMVALKAVDDTQVETSDGNANPDSNTQVETKVDQGPEPKPESEQRQSFISSSSDTRNVDTPQRTIDISTLVLPAQVLCFLPWCIAVGCALLVFPKHLEQLVFSSGYYFPSSATIFSSLGSNQASAPSRTGTPTRTSGSLSPKGIHRFAHLAEYTLPHISIFFGFLFMLLYVNPPLGLGVCAVLVGQGVIAWKDFREEDVVDVALGDDDRSSVYWILKRYVVGDSCWEFSVEDCGRICMVRGGEEYFSFGEVDESEGEGEGEE